jgi:hypothetical protein
MTLILLVLHLLIDKKCSYCQNMSFTTCHMQLLDPTLSKKWLRMYLSTSKNDPKKL